MDDSSMIQWVFRGNVVVPTGNPFRDDEIEDSEQKPPCDGDSAVVLWIGPGLKLLLDHVVVVDKSGFILRIDRFSHYSEWQQQLPDDPRFVQLEDHEFLCPGFIDLHIHAPQFSYTGTATDRPLMGHDGWLETYTFPAERRLGTDLAHAQRVYDALVRTTLACGTTTAVYFSTLHLEPCQVLVDAALRQGQRALIGKVCMDRNSPEDYIQTLQENVQETRKFIEYVHTKVGKEPQEGANATRTALPLVLPVVTPRFIPTCTPQLMTALGSLAAEYNCHIQSHMSESLDEVAFSRHLDVLDNPGQDETTTTGRTDAVIFDAHKLLRHRCIMAHGVHLTTSDMDLMKKRGSAVAHCPLSNFFFAGGSLPCRHLLERNNKVGLGTDVAGGYTPSMMLAARMAVVASRALEHSSIMCQEVGQSPNETKGKGVSMTAKNPTNNPCLDYRHAFYLATLGGAEALGLQHRIGTFAVGMELDAVVLSATVEHSPLQVFDTDGLADVFQKLCTLGDDRNVTRVFVQGRQVK